MVRIVHFFCRYSLQYLSSLHEDRQKAKSPQRAKSMTKKKKSAARDEFPLDAYIAVYNWIGNWAEEAGDPEQRVIAQAAYESLTAVGILMRDVMRQMRIEIEALPTAKTIQ
jgi:hypothetical protein